MENKKPEDNFSSNLTNNNDDGNDSNVLKLTGKIYLYKEASRKDIIKDLLISDSAAGIQKLAEFYKSIPEFVSFCKQTVNARLNIPFYKDTNIVLQLYNRIGKGNAMQLRITGWRIIPVLKHLTDANISNATYDINLLFYLGENNTFYLDLNLINPPGLYNVESGKEEKREGEHRSEEGSLLNEVTGKNSESNLEDNAYIYLQDLDLAENLKGSNIDLKKIRTALRIKKQIILMGPPGTSKSHLAIQIALIETNNNPKNIEQVQFHPAYAYEDFVECREPTGESFLKFEPQPRIFRNLCQRALKSKDDTFVLIIDEINRGNVERIFGELIFGLEYRDQRIRTLYFKEGLQIPSNLLIIGTMNTVDLSITNIDAALRRRFYIIELHPDPQILINYWSKHLQDQYPEFQSIIVNFMSELNILISEEPLIGPYRTIGHTIFMLKSISENISIEELWGLLELEWEYTIRPTLLEYLNFEAKKLKIIIEKINKKVTVENEMQQSVGIITYLEEINKKSA